MMNKEQFLNKWGMRTFNSDTEDILMIAASFMSDIQELTNDRYVVEKLNTLKEFIFDYRDVLKTESSPKCNTCSYDGVWMTMNI